MKIAGRLDAGKHSFLEGHAETSPIALPDGMSRGAGASPARGLWLRSDRGSLRVLWRTIASSRSTAILRALLHERVFQMGAVRFDVLGRSEEHTSELQSLRHLVCRLLL